jgi:D-aminoacyl-tRNA deacylase
VSVKVCIVYSVLDVASFNIAEALKKEIDFKYVDTLGGNAHFTSDTADLLELNSGLIYADFIGSLVKTDLAIFLSRHSSAKGVASFTAHAEGNWSDEAKFGGSPKSLGVASPVNMMAMLKAVKKSNTTEIPVMYEATHHGPLMDTPSFFVEIGGDEDAVKSREYANIIADSVVAVLSDGDRDYDKVAIGIGGSHYPGKFTKAALEGKYAFAHMMPKYQIGNVDMLQKAMERSDSAVEIAVIEWKSIKAADRDIVVGKLEELGLDYERI